MKSSAAVAFLHICTLPIWQLEHNFQFQAIPYGLDSMRSENAIRFSSLCQMILGLSNLKSLNRFDRLRKEMQQFRITNFL